MPKSSGIGSEDAESEDAGWGIILNLTYLWRYVECQLDVVDRSGMYVPLEPAKNKTLFQRKGREGNSARDKLGGHGRHFKFGTFHVL